MALTHTAVFAQAPKTASATVTAAYALTGAGSLLDDTPANTERLVSAGLDGSLVTSIRIIPRATVTASQVGLFIRKAAEPENKRKLIAALLMPAQTVSATARVIDYSFDVASESTPLRLQAGDELYVGLAVAQANGVNAHAVFTDF